MSKDIPDFKVCDESPYGCGQRKLSSEFHRNGATKDGLRNLCKSCIQGRSEDMRISSLEIEEEDKKVRACWGGIGRKVAGSIVERCGCGPNLPDDICYDHRKRAIEIIENDSIAIANNHVESCGRIPDWAVNRPTDSYLGYFENRHREQWIFLATNDQMRLAGGDLGWGEIHEETRPDWKAMQEALVQPGANVLFKDMKSSAFKDLVFDGPEAEWLTSCVRSAAERFSVR